MDSVDYPYEYNFSVQRGAYWELEIVHTEDDGTPIDFTGFTGICKWKRTYRDETVDKIFTTENGLMLLGSDGRMRLFNDASDSYGIELNGKYYYDIFIVAPDGKPEKFYYGIITVDNSVSKP